MLVTGKEILAVAKERSFAVGWIAIITGDSASSQASITAFNNCPEPALKAGTAKLLSFATASISFPVTNIAIHPEELKFLADSFIAQVKYAAEQTDIPVCIHLDRISVCSAAYFT